MPFTVLIAVDESTWAEAAFKYYLKELHREGSSVVVAHVSEPLFDPSSGFKAGLVMTPEQWQGMVKNVEEKRENIKKKFCNQLDTLKIVNRFVSEDGKDVGHHLCKISERDDVNMVVMGTRGMGTIRRTLLGSTSDYVLHHVHVPVVVCGHK